MNRKELLRETERLIYGDRNEEHGDPGPMMTRVAALWSAYKGVSFSPHDVAAMMILLKISRIHNSPNLVDSWIDIAGYAACGAEVLPSEWVAKALGERDESAPTVKKPPKPDPDFIGESWEYREDEE
jgi:hypothetical protein